MKKFNIKAEFIQILILSVLLVIIGFANYVNYYGPPKTSVEVKDFMSLSQSEQDKIRLGYSLKSEKTNNNIISKNNENNTNIADSEDNKKSNNSNSQPQVEELQDNIINGDNYLNFAANSNGQIVKWNKKNISVYVYDSEYNDIINQVLRKYNETFKGYFQLESASFPQQADIVIDVVDNFDSNDNQKELYMAGITNTYFDNKSQNLKLAKVKMLSKYPKNNKKVSAQDFYASLMHEMLHALGIIGHSPDRKDLMYAVSGNNKGEFTSRDRVTLKMMYSGNEEVLKKETANAQLTKLDEAKNYAKMNPNHAISWINLARIYYNANQKEDALEAYKKAIQIEPNNSDIYQSMGECYYSSEKYQAAINVLEKAYELSKEGSAKVNISNMIGICYAKLNNYESAYNYFKKAFVVRRNDKSILYNLISSCVQTDRKNEVKEYINMYKEVGNSIENDDIIKKAILWAGN